MSYNAGELKWGDGGLGTESGVITWSADLSTGLSFNDSLYSIEDFEAALQAAFDRWEEVAAVDFAYSNDADVDIEVSMGALEGSTVGLAWYSYIPQTGVDEIIDATVTMDSLEFWSPYGSGALDFFAVALHEIGHTLGLGHVEDTSEIMNPYVSTANLGDGDIAGIRYLYGDDGVIVPSPTIDDAVPTEPLADDPDAPAPALADDSGGGGGAIAAVLGLLALVFGMFLGGGGAAVAALAATRADDDDAPSDPEVDGPMDEFLPIVQVHSDEFFASEEDYLNSDHDLEDDDFFALI